MKARELAAAVVGSGAVKRLEVRGLHIVFAEEHVRQEEDLQAFRVLLAKLPDSAFRGIKAEVIERVHSALRGRRENEPRKRAVRRVGT